MKLEQMPITKKVVLSLTEREAEQVMLEIHQLQLYARTYGPILDDVLRQLGDLGLTEAPYPGHSDTWPHWQAEYASGRSMPLRAKERGDDA